MRTADIHNHAIPQGFIDRVRDEGARYGYKIRTMDGGGEELITPDWPVEVTKDGGQHIRPRRSDETVRRQDLANAGIDVAIEGLMPPLMSYGGDKPQAQWGSRAVNDALAENTRKFPKAIYALATVPLQFPELAARELARVVEEHGIRGVQIGSNVKGENLDSPELDPFWDAAQALDVLVFIHPHQQAAKSRLSRYYLQNLIGNPLETSIAAASLIFGGVLERFLI